MMKAVIFDWGRTLYDSEQGALFPAVPTLLADLSQRYALAVVSLVSGDYASRVAARRAAIAGANIGRFFAATLFVPDDKEGAYRDVLAQLAVSATEVAIVDDRMRRGIAWGNAQGALTIWLRRGRFADELPDAATGLPTHTIGSIEELATIL
jgi:FMN phosphatase YigB (HAD superfamily)